MALVCTTALHPLLHTDEAGPLVGGGPHDWVLLLLLPRALLAPGGDEAEFKVAFYAKVEG